MFWAWMRDSKKLSAKRREELFGLIRESKMVPWAVGSATHEEIDQLGIAPATKLAGRRALRSLINSWGLEDGEYEVIVDGDDGWGIGTAIVKADDSVREVSAASIVAKVVRDEWLSMLSVGLPVYGFDRNAGYGTPEHLAAIAKYGPSAIHRMTFAPMKDMK